jgi:hypothetical protein
MELRRKRGEDSRFRACHSLVAHSTARAGRTDACCQNRSAVAAAGFADSFCDHEEGFVESRRCVERDRYFARSIVRCHPRVRHAAISAFSFRVRQN